MARKTVVHLTDDLDQKELNERGRTVTFSIQETEYEIDLSDENVQKLHDALAPYIAAGRRVGGRASAGVSTAARNNSKQLQEMRKWARAQGLKVSERGRLSKEVRDAYDAARA